MDCIEGTNIFSTPLSNKFNTKYKANMPKKKTTTAKKTTAKKAEVAEKIVSYYTSKKFIFSIIPWTAKKINVFTTQSRQNTQKPYFFQKKG